MPMMGLGVDQDDEPLKIDVSPNRPWKLSRKTIRIGLLGIIIVIILAIIATAVAVLTTRRQSHKNVVNSDIPLRILPLGDSITWGAGSSDNNGYRAKLRSLLEMDRVTVSYVGSLKSGTMSNNDNEGHPGEYLSNMTAHAARSTPKRPNVVLVKAGSNDMLQGLDPETAPGRLESLVDAILTPCPDAVVIVAMLLPIGNIWFTDGHADTRVRAFNKAIPPLVKRFQDDGHKVLEADMYAAVPLGDLPDLIHPNDGGYEKMARVWYTAIAEASTRGWITPPAKVSS